MKTKLRSILVFALPYIAMMLFPMISVFCLGSMVVTNYREKIIMDKQKSIESAFERFVQRVDDIESLAFMIAQNSVMMNYAYGSLGDLEHTLIENMEVRDVLHDLWVNDDLETIYFYDARDNRIITPNAVLSYAQDFFKYSYKLQGYTAEECIERLKEGRMGAKLWPAMKVLTDDEKQEKEVIEYSVAMPFGVTVKERSRLVMVMDAKKIFKDLYDVLREEGEFYAYDSQNQLIFGSGIGYQEMIDDKVYSIMLQSQDESWKVKVVLPDLMKEKNIMQPYVWLLTAVPLVGSMILCSFFTYKNHREIQNMLSNITNLENSAKHEIFDKLVRNIYRNKEELTEDLRKGKLNIQDESCVVVCIRFKDSAYRTVAYESITGKEFVKKILYNIIECKFELFDISSKEIICVLPANMDNYEIKIQNMVSRLRGEIDYQYQIQVGIGVGNVIESLYYLSDSYKQAKAVIRYQENAEKNVYMYSELLNLTDIYFYPREYDEKIYYFIINGQGEEAKEIIRKIYRENFEENVIIPSAKAISIIKNRLRELLETLSRIYDVGVEDTLTNHGMTQDENGSVTSFFEKVCKTVDEIEEKIGDKKKSIQQNSALKIMEYIDENFCDNMLSLKQISAALGMSESYVSRLFKNEYGENLSVVIERRRIEKARDLIRNTEMKISEIAEAVGYSSDASFRRAYKKIVGQAPGEGFGRGERGGV